MIDGKGTIDGNKILDILILAVRSGVNTARFVLCGLYMHAHYMQCITISNYNNSLYIWCSVWVCRNRKHYTKSEGVKSWVRQTKITIIF